METRLNRKGHLDSPVAIFVAVPTWVALQLVPLFGGKGKPKEKPPHWVQPKTDTPCSVKKSSHVNHRSANVSARPLKACLKAPRAFDVDFGSPFRSNPPPDKGNPQKTQTHVNVLVFLGISARGLGKTPEDPPTPTNTSSGMGSEIAISNQNGLPWEMETRTQTCHPHSGSSTFLATPIGVAQKSKW